MSNDPLAADVRSFMKGLEKRNPAEHEFHQAVNEVAGSLMPFINSHGAYKDARILERMTEPDRVVIFRVCWQDDDGNVRTNRAWRVQFNNAIGPYKGGMRFHPSVNLSVLKFLGFEQTFKNALTGLPMGGAKGGSNFNPKGKSDLEVMRFCQSLMTELHRHIGEDTDVPAGDIGVGSREVSYMFGQYKRLENRFVGALTGKGLSFGGSRVRTEATGYGAAYFMESMLERKDDGIRGKKCVVSGSGNVALYCIEKINQLGGIAVTASDSSGFIYDPDGIRGEKWEFLRELKEERRGRVEEYATKFGCEFHPGKTPWSVACDLAFPCATQNELGGDDAKALLANGCRAVSEGANMPSTLDAIDAFLQSKILFAPGKASNAGGVGVSGLEQSQNALRIAWSAEEVDGRLQEMMKLIHSQCVEHGAQKDGFVNYVDGANIAGFVKVADAMLAYGIV